MSWSIFVFYNPSFVHDKCSKWIWTWFAFLLLKGFEQMIFWSKNWKEKRLDQMAWSYPSQSSHSLLFFSWAGLIAAALSLFLLFSHGLGRLSSFPFFFSLGRLGLVSFFFFSFPFFWWVGPISWSIHKPGPVADCLHLKGMLGVRDFLFFFSSPVGLTRTSLSFFFFFLKFA